MKRVGTDDRRHPIIADIDLRCRNNDPATYQSTMGQLSDPVGRKGLSLNDDSE
jgi:hypothetical protein